MKTEVTELAVAGAASKTSYTTAIASAVLGFLGSNAFAVVFGALITLATFAVNLYYRRKADQRLEAAELRRQELHKINLLRAAAGLPLTPEIERPETQP